MLFYDRQSLVGGDYRYDWYFGRYLCMRWGMVRDQFSYMQMVLGFSARIIMSVAATLHKLNLTTIYTI